MKDLMRLVAVCQADLYSLGIKYGNVRTWTVNTRAKCRLGQCRKVAVGLFDISISNALLDDEVDEQTTLNTIMHELLHTVPGCFTHKGKWKIYSQFINKKLPQYTIKRVVKESETGIAIKDKKIVYRYILRCTKCGQEICRQKMSKLVQNPQRYRCGKCGGILRLIKADI